MNFESRLTELGFVLPPPPRQGGNYVSAKTVGELVFLAGVVSAQAGSVITGTAGVDRTLEEGYAAARTCVLGQLAILKAHLGTLDRISEVVSLNGYVCAAPGFAETPGIINGASDLLVELFGDSGRHVRAAVGCSALPRHALVEVQMVVRVRPEAP